MPQLCLWLYPVWLHLLCSLFLWPQCSSLITMMRVMTMTTVVCQYPRHMNTATDLQIRGKRLSCSRYSSPGCYRYRRILKTQREYNFTACVYEKHYFQQWEQRIPGFSILGLTSPLTQIWVTGSKGTKFVSETQRKVPPPRQTKVADQVHVTS